MVKEELCENVVDMRKVSNRVRLCSTRWKKLPRKQPFCDEFKGMWDMRTVDDVVICLGVTIMDMRVGIFMDLIVFMVDMV